jgi:hypothetical protein
MARVEWDWLVLERLQGSYCATFPARPIGSGSIPRGFDRQHAQRRRSSVAVEARDSIEGHLLLGMRWFPGRRRVG